MGKNNADYWKKRFEELERINHQRGKSFVYKIEKQYQIAMDAIEKDLSKWYLRFSKNNEISYVDARKLLNSRELKEFRWNVDQYMEKAKNNIDGRWTKQLENASAKVHITRLDALKMQMQQHVEELFGNYNDQTSEHLNSLYTHNFYHAAYEVAKGTGVGINFARLDKKMVDLVIHKPWASDGKEFSSRIWENRSKLVNTLHSELTTAIIKGDAPQKTIKAVAKKMDVSESQAENLVLTETAALSSRATQDSYQELGLKRYEILATLDSRTSEVCRSMDGKKFNMKDYQVGVTAPPFHPRCRTTTIPDIDRDITGERAARGEDGKTYYVPADMTYQQWKETFVADTADVGKLKSLFNKGIDKKLKLFDKELSIVKNTDARKLLEQSKERVKIEKSSTKRSSYRNGTVYLAKDAQTSTIAHELFHEIDQTYGISEDHMISEQIQKDYQRLRNVARGYGNSIEDMLYSRYQDAFTDSKRGIKFKPEYRGISDIINGMSQGKIKTGFHHDVEYWKRENALEKETWAQFGRILFEQNEEVMDLLSELLPETTSEVLRILKEMIK